MPIFETNEQVLLSDSTGAEVLARVLRPATARRGRGVHVPVKVTGIQKTEFKRFEIVKAHPSRLRGA
jgi:hypothetical protein